MIRCPSCQHPQTSVANNCSVCGFKPDILEGFKSYAPELAYGGGGFKSDYFSELARLEESNFWFRARNQFIVWAIGRYCGNFQSLLEIGCGTGYVLSGLSQAFPSVALSGSEIFISGLGFASARTPSASFMQIDARNIPFENEFDVIGAFDVLEHIEEDVAVLAQVHAALNPRGFMLLTVPQHAWLWSATDEHAHHARRYSAADLHEKIKATGFQVLRSTSFVTTLLPAMMASRLLRKDAPGKQFDAAAEFRISPWLNTLFFHLLGFELALIRRGVDFPAGGSRLVVARKN